MREVTLLFTDIEGSTSLARSLGNHWGTVIATHHAVLERAIAEHGGTVERTAGDSFFALFDEPAAAVTAAASAQRALAAQVWPDPSAVVRVRIGIHSGLVERVAGELQGLDIHLAARVQSAAHGEQVVVSDATRQAATGVDGFVDLGEHRLKDFPAPERLWLLDYDGRGPGAFPPLRTEPVRPTNLPPELRAIVGREAEIAELAGRLEGGQRLVTVTGLGGTGKTRLAGAAGERLLGRFAGGVWFVGLAGVRDPDDVPSAIASAVGVADAEGISQLDAIVQRLRDKPALLILDNFEQVVDAAGVVGDLLGRAPELRVLVTSQRPLRIAAEHVLALDPLAAEAAAALFAERAAAADPHFRASEHAATVAAICERLDGMPLALELAAARVAALGVEELLVRLDRSLAVLVRGPRDLPERQRSLRAALEWSFDLLEPDARVLFSRLGAFAGAAPLDAVEAVAFGLDALDALEDLVAASLVRRVESRQFGLRYTMPQAARDFASEHLAASGEETVVRTAHARHVAAVMAPFSGWGVPAPVIARARAIDAETRVALDWSRTQDPALHLEVASGLGFYLYRGSGRAREAREELSAAIERAGVTGVHGGVAAIALAMTVQSLDRAPEGEPLAEAGLAALRAAGDERALNVGLGYAALYWSFREQHDAAVECALEALAISRRLGTVPELAVALFAATQVLVQAGRIDEAKVHLREAEPLLPQVGDPTLVYGTVGGDVALLEEDWEEAARCYVESITAALPLTNQVVTDLHLLTYVALRLGSADAALELDALATRLIEETGQLGLEDGFPEGRVEETLALRLEHPERTRAAVARAGEVPLTGAGQRAAEIMGSLGR